MCRGGGGSASLLTVLLQTDDGWFSNMLNKQAADMLFKFEGKQVVLLGGAERRLQRSLLSPKRVL